MKLTAAFVPADSGGFTAFIEEIPEAMATGETVEEARGNLADTLRTWLESNRELARRNEPSDCLRESLEFAAL